MARSAPDENGLVVPGQETTPAPAKRGRHTRRKTRRFKKTKRALIIVAVLVLMLAGSGVGYAWYLNHKAYGSS
jgi:cell division septal protein FtsQ